MQPLQVIWVIITCKSKNYFQENTGAKHLVLTSTCTGVHQFILYVFAFVYELNVKARPFEANSQAKVHKGLFKRTETPLSFSKPWETAFRKG